MSLSKANSYEPSDSGEYNTLMGCTCEAEGMLRDPRDPRNSKDVDEEKGGPDDAPAANELGYVVPLTVTPCDEESGC